MKSLDNNSEPAPLKSGSMSVGPMATLPMLIDSQSCPPGTKFDWNCTTLYEGVIEACTNKSRPVEELVPFLTLHDLGIVELDRLHSVRTQSIFSLDFTVFNVSAPTSAGHIELDFTMAQEFRAASYGVVVGPAHLQPHVRVELHSCDSPTNGLVHVSYSVPDDNDFWMNEVAGNEQSVRFEISGQLFDGRFEANGTDLSMSRQLRVWFLPMARHRDIGFIEFEVVLWDAGLDALLAFAVIGFIVVLCFPCCVFAWLAVFSKCCCRGKCGPKAIVKVVQNGFGCCGKGGMKCLETSTSVAAFFTTLVSLLSAAAAILGVAFNIAVFNRAITWAEPALPSLTDLAQSFLVEFHVDVTPFLLWFDGLLDWVPSLTVGGVAECAGIQIIWSTIVMLLTMWIVCFIVFADLPGIIVAGFASGGVASELLATGLSKLLIFAMQVALLSQYDVGLQLGASSGGVKEAVALRPCTDFDGKVAEAFFNIRIAAFALALFVTLLTFLAPRAEGGIRLKSQGGTCITACTTFFSGCFHSVLISGGVWLPWSLAHFQIEERASKYDSGGDAGQALISIQAKVQSLVFLLLPPPAAVLTKLAEAANDPPLFVFKGPIGLERLGMDPLASRIVSFTLSMALFVFELIAATTGEPWALVAAACVVVVSFLVDVVTALFRVAWRKARIAKQKLADRKSEQEARKAEQEARKAEQVFRRKKHSKRARGKDDGDDGGDADLPLGQFSGSSLSSAVLASSNLANLVSDKKELKKAQTATRRRRKSNRQFT